MVGLSKIQKDVRIVLDHNEVQASIAGFGEDQLQLDDIIENSVETAARLLLLMAPRSYVDWVKWSQPPTEYGMIGTWAGFPATGAYAIRLPDDFLRFGGVKMGSWTKAVSTYCNTSDEEYAMQQSEFGGVRATARKPLAVIAEDGNGGRELLLYPCASGDTLQFFTYCKQLKLTGSGTSRVIDIKDTLYQPFIYLTAALVAEVLKDTDKSNELMSGAKLMLTVPEEVPTEQR